MSTSVDNNRKRKRNDEESDDEDSKPRCKDRRTDSAKSPAIDRASVTNADDDQSPSPSPKDSNPADSFTLLKKKHYDEAMVELDLWWTSRNNRVNLPGENIVLQGQSREEHLAAELKEYERARSRLADMYIPAAGDVVIMGSNDLMQMGRPYEIEEAELAKDRLDRFPPHFLTGIPVSDQTIQVAAGGMHSAALTVDGSVFTWGSDDKGALGRVTTEETLSPFPVSGFNQSRASPCYDGHEKEDGQILSIAAGNTSTVFLTVNGNVYTAGCMYTELDGSSYRDVPLGDSTDDDPLGFNTTPIHVLMPQKVQAIYAGSQFNAALLADGTTLMTWGVGTRGEMGRSAQMDPDSTTVTTGGYDLGRLLKDEQGRFRKKMIVDRFLTPAPVIYGRLPQQKKSVISVACGAAHMLVVARDPGQLTSLVYATGDNKSGQLGLGQGISRVHELASVPFFEDKNIAKVAAGDDFSLALELGGSKLYSFGRAEDGRLGLLREGDAALQPIEFLPKQVTFPESNNVRIKDISAGGSTSMAIDFLGNVYTWGFNESGATGHAAGGDFLRPQMLPLHNLLNINGNEMNNDNKGENEDNATMRVLRGSMGGQHSVMIVTRALRT